MNPIVRASAIASALCVTVPEATESGPVPSPQETFQSRSGTTLYQQDFEEVQYRAEPQDLFILDGRFEKDIHQENSVLRLHGEPLAEFGALFGPSGTDNIGVSLRVWAEAKGRRYPVFGLGLNGITGARLLVDPAVGHLRLSHRDTILQTAPIAWQSGSWMSIVLQITRFGEDLWKIRGKAWKANEKEPENWAISLASENGPRKGKASLWGIPYSGKDILFDDLRVFATEGRAMD